MNTIAYEKLPAAESADVLLEERSPETPLVMVRTAASSQGYWGRGHSVKSALRASKWLTKGDDVEVFLCNMQTYTDPVFGHVRSDTPLGPVYRGKVTAYGDVRVTHKRVEPKG